MLRHPRLVVVCSLLFVASMGVNLAKVEIDPSIKTMMPEDFPAWINIERFEDLFSASEMLLVAVETDDLLEEETLRSLSAFQEKLEELADAYRVVSVFTVRYLEAEKNSFKPSLLIDPDSLPRAEELREETRKRLLTDDMYVGNIVSDDLGCMAFIILPNEDFDDERLALETMALAKGTFGDRAIVTGLPSTRTEVSRGVQGDLKTFLPIGIVLMVLLLVLSFRTWLGAILPLLVVVMSIVSTFGLMGLIGEKIRMVTVIMPVMLIAVANDYGIHLVAHFLGRMSADPDGNPKEHAYHVAKSLGVPIMAAGLTTVAGFLTLLSHVIPAVQMSGLLSAFGVVVAFVLSLTFVPAMLTLLRPPRRVVTGFNSGLMTNALRFLCAHLRKHGPGTVLALMVLGLAGATGIVKLKVDTDPVHYFHTSSPMRQANEYVNRVFGGSAQLNVVVEGDIKQPALLRKMEKLQEFLEAKPMVSRTQSVVDTVKKMNRAFHNDDEAFEVIPDSREVVAQFLLLYSFQSDLSDFDHLVDLSYTHAQIAARVNSTSSSDLTTLVNDTEAFIDSNLGRDEFTMVTGFVSILGTLLDLIVRGQIISLILSLFLVYVIGAAVFRSMVGGLYVSLPIVMAVAFVFGLMGYFKIELNVATAMLSSILVGVGVDYIIHFLWHYRTHLRKVQDPWEAVELTLFSSGRGIIVNALSVVIGFSVLLASNFLPIFFFGFLLTISISSCLVAAVVILPVAVTTFRPAFLTAGGAASAAEPAETVCLEASSGWLFKLVEILLLVALSAGIVYLLYWAGGRVVGWYGALPAGTGFWTAIWGLITENGSISVALYVLICLNSSGVAEFKFGKPLVKAFLLSVPLTPVVMMIWARATSKASPREVGA